MGHWLARCKLDRVACSFCCGDGVDRELLELVGGSLREGAWDVRLETLIPLRLLAGSSNAWHVVHCALTGEGLRTCEGGGAKWLSVCVLFWASKLAERTRLLVRQKRGKSERQVRTSGLRRSEHC